MCFVHMQASGVVPQLKYISKKDFPTVREAACKALQALGMTVCTHCVCISINHWVHVHNYTITIAFVIIITTVR